MSGDPQDHNQVTSRTLNQALAQFVDKWRTRWYPDKEELLPPFQRTLYAGTGAFSFFLLRGSLLLYDSPQEVTDSIFTTDFFSNITIGEFSMWFISGFVIPVILPTLFFGFLVGYASERRGGPISIYLDGILLPMITVLLITLPEVLR